MAGDSGKAIPAGEIAQGVVRCLGVHGARLDEARHLIALPLDALWR
jgi:hypothetical protein